MKQSDFRLFLIPEKSSKRFCDVQCFLFGICCKKFREFVSSSKEL